MSDCNCGATPATITVTGAPTPVPDGAGTASPWKDTIVLGSPIAISSDVQVIGAFTVKKGEYWKTGEQLLIKDDSGYIFATVTDPSPSGTSIQITLKGGAYGGKTVGGEIGTGGYYDIFPFETPFALIPKREYFDAEQVPEIETGEQFRLIGIQADGALAIDDATKRIRVLPTSSAGILYLDGGLVSLLVNATASPSTVIGLMGFGTGNAPGTLKGAAIGDVPVWVNESGEDHWKPQAPIKPITTNCITRLRGTTNDDEVLVDSADPIGFGSIEHSFMDAAYGAWNASAPFNTFTTAAKGYWHISAQVPVKIDSSTTVTKMQLCVRRVSGATTYFPLLSRELTTSGAAEFQEYMTLSGELFLQAGDTLQLCFKEQADMSTPDSAFIIHDLTDDYNRQARWTITFGGFIP